MSEARVRIARHKAAQRQDHRCYYCNFPMWEHGETDFAKRHGISPAEARRFKCTAEHLHALGDGGTSRADNIVAACIFCNRLRHARKARITAEQFAALVRRRLANQAWHPHWLHKLRSVGSEPASRASGRAPAPIGTSPFNGGGCEGVSYTLDAAVYESRK